MKDLAAALAAAQSEYPIVKAEHLNTKTNKLYAPLHVLVSATRTALGKNNLATVTLFERDDTDIILTTMLLHSSGESIKSQTRLSYAVDDINDPLIDFYRRKHYECITGVVVDGHDTEPETEANTEQYECISQEQVHFIAGELGDNVDLTRALLKQYSIKKLGELPKEHYHTIVKKIRQNQSI